MGSSFNNYNNSSIYNNASMLRTPLGRVYTAPPPLPPRPNRSAYNTGYSSYMSPSPFNGFGNYYTPNFSPGYRGYGYGRFRPAYNSFGYYGNYPENRFIQMAEESSRPAFESIQSVLEAFSSVTMMFESSFHAIYSSYMSVLGVADNLSKLRSVFGQIFSTFALIRGLGWLYRRILYTLGIDRDRFLKESWSGALSGMSELKSENKTERKQMWPTIIFLSIIIGGPYLLFKIMSEHFTTPVPVWIPAQRPGPLAVGLYDFQSGLEQELSFAAQQKLMIAPKNFQPNDCQGWLLACDENQEIGLVPYNFVKILEPPGNRGQTEFEQNQDKNVDNSKPIVDEVNVKDSEITKPSEEL